MSEIDIHEVTTVAIEAVLIAGERVDSHVPINAIEVCDLASSTQK